MGRRREPLSDLVTRGSPNLARAIKLRAEEPERPQKRAELERLFDDTLQLYEASMADVRQRGAVLKQTKYTLKGLPYEVEVQNPHLLVAQKCESKLTHLVKLLQKFPEPRDPDAPVPGSGADMFPDLFYSKPDDEEIPS